MAIGIDDYFRTSETALKLRAYRQEVLASNIANADTPGYKARDFDFSKSFEVAMGRQQSGQLAQTNALHQQPASLRDLFAPALQYKGELQSSIDGNTVDMDTEMTAFTDNAIRYQASVVFMQGKIDTMKKALQSQ